MRLRVSGEQTGNDYNLSAVMTGSNGEQGLPHGDLLNNFLEAIFDRDTDRITKIRTKLVNAMGEQAMIDATATIAAFNAYPRMADSTGIPLENAKKEATAELRTALGLDRLKHE